MYSRGKRCNKEDGQLIINEIITHKIDTIIDAKVDFNRQCSERRCSCAHNILTLSAYHDTRRSHRNKKTYLERPVERG